MGHDTDGSPFLKVKTLFSPIPSGLLPTNLLILSASLFLLLATAAPATARQTLAGHVPTAVTRLPALGPLPATNRLQLAIGLPLRNQ